MSSSALLIILNSETLRGIDVRYMPKGHDNEELLNETGINTIFDKKSRNFNV